MDAELRIRKENFVYGLSGGSPAEVSLVLLCVSSALVLCRAVSAPTPARALRSRPVATKGQLFSEFFWEFHSLVVPTLLCLTLFADFSYLVLLALLALATLFSALRLHSMRDRRVDPLVALTGTVPPPGIPRWVPFLGESRAMLLICTALSILAVDFQAFPRRFAKTEFYGTSLMDLGVGAFVCSMGLSRGFSHVQQKEQSSFRVTVQALRVSLPLFALGIVRLYLVKATNYHVHISEYGAHWSFFITLALMSLTIGIFDISVADSLAVSTVALTLHQCILFLGAESYAREAPRGSSLLAQNREGVKILFQFGF